MLCCILTVNSIDRYISDGSTAGNDTTYQWKPYILSFSSPKFTLSNKYGGRAKMDFGSLDLSPEVFTYPGRLNNPPDDWPPPRTCAIKIWFCDTTDDLYNSNECQYLFAGTAHLEKFSKESVQYSIWDEDSDVYALATGTDYDGEEIDLPRVFGDWDHYACKRMEDWTVGPNDYPTYHTGYMETGSTWDAAIITYVEDNGSGKVRFHTSAVHGYTTGDIITTEDVNFYYWDTSAVTVIDTDTFDKDNLDWVGTPTTSDYSSTTIQAGNSWIQNTGHAYTPGQFRVYDGGIPITGNHTRLTGLDGRPYEFYLSHNPVGEVTVSGTGSKYGPDTTVSLKDVIDLMSLNDWLSFALVKYDTGMDSIAVSWLVGSQIRAWDFISNLCASFHYWIQIRGTNSGYSYNMIQAASDQPDHVLEEHQYFSIDYDYENPTMNVSTSWQTRTSVEDNTGKYVKEEDKEITETSTLYNYGDELSVDYYNQKDPSNASTVIAESLALVNRPRIRVKLPLLVTSPAIGDKVRVIDFSSGPRYDTDDRFALTTEFYVRNATYNMDTDEMEIEGDGIIYQYIEGHEQKSNRADI